MKKLLLTVMIIALLAVPVQASQIEAPAVPEAGEEYMPEDVDSFGEGLWYIIKKALSKLQPDLVAASGICVSLIAIVLFVSVLNGFSEKTKGMAGLAGSIAVGVLLISPSNTFIQLGVENVTQLSDYGKLLLPVMTSAMAAQGSLTGSAALYTGTALFSSILTTLITKLVVPMLYIYLCLCIANSVITEDILKNMRDFVKWLMTWALKLVLYVFTGYIGITGVVSGSADAAAVKAAKLTLSGTIPVVGGIISEASETILIGAGVVKNAVGIYGLLAIASVWIGPFLQIGIQYLLLKLTGAVCGVLGSKQTTGLIQDFSGAMGIVLGMTGTVGLLLMISTVCFMKGLA